MPNLSPYYQLTDAVLKTYLVLVLGLAASNVQELIFYQNSSVASPETNSHLLGLDQATLASEPLFVGGKPVRDRVLVALVVTPTGWWGCPLQVELGLWGITHYMSLVKVLSPPSSSGK